MQASAARYEVVKKLGNGAFGEVLLGRDVVTNQLVALKKVFIKDVKDGIPECLAREIHALRSVDHPNVVHLADVYPKGHALVLVQEHCRSDLANIIQHCVYRIPIRIIKGTFLQLLQGLEACHSAGILHRDVKPGNILVASDGTVKLADFGLARPIDTSSSRPAYTHAVATRWYRAPELLFGARHYSTAVDMWGAGMVLAELLGLGPLVPGGTDVDQLARVVRLLGSVDLDQWPEAAQLPDWGKIQFPHSEGVPLAQQLPDAPSDAVQLLEALLQYNPDHRPSAAQLLQHEWFWSEPPPAGAQHVAVWMEGVLAAQDCSGGQ